MLKSLSKSICYFTCQVKGKLKFINNSLSINFYATDSGIIIPLGSIAAFKTWA